MKKVLCILLLAVLAAGCALADAASLTVQGTGSVSLSADTATITLGIRKYDTDVKAAQQAVEDAGRYGAFRIGGRALLAPTQKFLIPNSSLLTPNLPLLTPSP